MEALIVHVSDPFNPASGGNGNVLSLDEPCSVDNLIEQFSIPVDITPTICLVNGDAVLRDSWNAPLVLEDKSCVVFLALPHGGGDDGGSNPMKIILSIIMIVLTVLTYGWAAAAWGPAWGAVAAAVVSTAGNLLINAILPPPGLSGADGIRSAVEQGGTVYSLNGRANLARINQPIAVIYGYHLVYPDYMAQPYAFYHNNDQWLDQLFCIGKGYYDFVLEPKIGESGFSDFGDDVFYKIYEPGDVIDDFYQAVYNADTGSQELEGSVPSNIIVANPATTVINQIQIDVVCPRGLYYANDSGGLDGKSVRFSVSARPIDDTDSPIGGWILFPHEDIVGGTPVEEEEPTLWPNLVNQHLIDEGILPLPEPKGYIAGGTTTPIRKSFIYPVPEGRYEVRVERNDEEDTDSRAGHKLVWAGMSGILEGSNSYSDITCVMVRMRASDGISQQSQRSVNFTVQRKLPIYDPDTGWSAPVATRNAAWAIADMIKESGLDYSVISLSELCSLAVIADLRGDCFDIIFDSLNTLMEGLVQAARNVRAKAYVQGGLIRVVRDQLMTIPVAQFSPRNIVKNSFSIKYLIPNEDIADEVIVEYFDKDVWIWKEVVSDVYTSNPVSPARVRFKGCIERAHAYREACFMSACNRLRRKVITFSTELEGHIPRLLDLILVSHHMVKWGKSGDVVGWDGENFIVEGDEVFPWDGGNQHYISLRLRDGSATGPIPCVQGISPEFAVLSGDPGFTPDIGTDREKTQYIFGLGGQVGHPCRVLNLVPRSDNRVEIIAVGENIAVHGADGGEIPADPVGWVDLPSNSQVERPNIGQLYVVQGGTPNSPALNISWTPAVGAERYLVDFSYNGTDWTRLKDTTGREITFHCEFGEIWIRVAGVGLARGDWQIWNGVVTTAIPPGDVQFAEVINSPDGDEWAFTWEAVNRAEEYEIVVRNNSIKRRTVYTRDTKYSYTKAQQSVDGGPFRSVSFRISAVNAAGKSSNPHLLFVSNPAPDFTGYDPTLYPLYEAIKVDWSTFYPDDPDLSYFEIRCDKFSPPTTIVGTAPASAMGFTIDNLEAGETYYVEVIPWDSFGIGGGSNIVSDVPLVIGGSGTASEIAQSVGISDSESTVDVTLRELYDRVFNSGGPVYDRTGSPASDFWIEFDYGVGFMIDMVQFFLSVGGARVYVGIDTDGQDSWRWFGAIDNTDHGLSNGQLLEKADQSTAQAAYFEAAAGSNVAVLPPRVPGKKCRLYFTGSGLADPHQVHELRFDRQVHAEQIYAESLSAISSNLGYVEAGAVDIGPKVGGLPVGAQFKVNDDGSFRFQTGQEGDFIIFDNTALKVYQNNLLVAEFGELSE